MDIQLSIAQLALAQAGPEPADLSDLRARYPELAFVFDALEDAQAAQAQAELEHDDALADLRDERHRAEENLADVAARLRRLAQLAHITAQLTYPAPHDTYVLACEIDALSGWASAMEISHD